MIEVDGWMEGRDDNTATMSGSGSGAMEMGGNGVEKVARANSVVQDEKPGRRGR